MANSSLSGLFGLFFIVLLTFSLYLLGVNGPFLLDDFHNIEGIAIDGGVVQFDDLLRYVFGIDGLDFSRSLPRLTFVLNDQFWPSWPYFFKLTNIAIHLMNGLLIALLLTRLLPVWLSRKAAERVALLCAALWLLHPLHVSTALYVVQRMTQLMLFFSLLSLIFYGTFRQAETVVGALLALFCSGGCAILAVLSKESAAILLLLFPLLEWFCFRTQRSRFQLFSKYLSLILGVLFVVIFIKIAIDSYDVFDSRVFTLWERLQIQGWVLSKYLWYLIIPGAEGMGIFHDDLEWQIQVAGAGYSGLYWLLHLAIGVIAWRWFRGHPVVIFGLAWFYLGHLIESSIIPLELMFEHRNYFSSIGLFLIAAYLLGLSASRLRSKGLHVLAAVLILVPLVYMSVQLAHRAALWSDHRILVHKWAVEHPYSLRSQYAQVALLEQDGFTEEAVLELLRQEQVFDDLVLPLQRIRLECKVDPFANSKNTLDIIRFSIINYTSGVGPALEKLIQFPHRDCIDRQLKGGELGDLIAAVESMPLLRDKARNYAQYLDIVDEYYLRELQYTRAIINREKLWEVQPSLITALKLVELFSLGGNFAEARSYLKLAEAEDQRRWFKDTLATRTILKHSQLLDNFEASQSGPRVAPD